MTLTVCPPPADLTEAPTRPAGCPHWCGTGANGEPHDAHEGTVGGARFLAADRLPGVETTPRLDSVTVYLDRVDGIDRDHGFRHRTGQPVITFHATPKDGDSLAGSATPAEAQTLAFAILNAVALAAGIPVAQSDELAETAIARFRLDLDREQAHQQNKGRVA